MPSFSLFGGAVIGPRDPVLPNCEFDQRTWSPVVTNGTVVEPTAGTVIGFSMNRYGVEESRSDHHNRDRLPFVAGSSARSYTRTVTFRASHAFTVTWMFTSKCVDGFGQPANVALGTDHEFCVTPLTSSKHGGNDAAAVGTTAPTAMTGAAHAAPFTSVRREMPVESDVELSELFVTLLPSAMTAGASASTLPSERTLVVG